MAARGRAPGFKMPDSHRDKIVNSNLLNNLVAHANGERDMTSTQVTAAIALLKKVMPDLAAMQHSGDATEPLRVIISKKDAEL